MVVGPEFDGKMKWTLAYAGTSTGTSERMLQSNWNLVEGAADLKKIDYAKVPRGVCLNRAPTVRVLSGPGTVTFTIPGSARTKATFSAPGTYELELTATDSEFTERTRVNVKVGP